MVDYVWKFAKSCQEDALNQSVTKLAIRHPTVVIELGEIPTPESIRAKKAEIQRNEANLNIKRVNISVIISPKNGVKGRCVSGGHTFSAAAKSGPENPLDFDLALALEQTGRLLRSLFEEDFSVVHLSLFILMSESQEDIEARSAVYLRLLKHVRKFQKDGIFNLVWLLSDRNEHNEVKEEHMQKNREIIKILPAVISDSSFEDRVGGNVFSTAGIARLTKPTKEIAFCVFRRVFSHIIKSAGHQPVRTSDRLDHPAVQAAVGVPVSEEQMIRDMASVAEDKVSGRTMHKRSIREVEQLLYGNRARLFFEANFTGRTAEFDVEAVLETARGYVLQNGLAAAEAYRPGPLTELDERITSYEQEIDLRYRDLYSHKPFSGTQKVKETIAGIYAVRSQLERLRRMRDVMTELNKELDSFCDRCSEFAKKLNELEEALGAEKLGRFVAEYYEPAADRIIEELQKSPGPVYSMLEEELNEGIESLLAHIGEFVKEHVLPHPALQLTFEEDQKARAALSFDSYDREHLLREADSQAALAASLLRYDDLIFEKHYMEDSSGITVLRLAGGFELEGLARYRGEID